MKTKPTRSSTGPARAFRDGPLSIRRPEEIVFGTGKSALGPVLVASGGQGIVSIIVRKKADELVGELRQRFPKANLVRDEKACKPLIVRATKFIAAPGGQFGLPLDLRGTEFQQRVWNAVRKIPLGQTSTYAKIADSIGAPKAIRAVASSCSRCMFAFAVPCHRVLHSAAGRKPDHGDARRLAWVEYEAGLVAR
ncbi:MAG: methylated-DNA--[protein]-cysteine S-methyltransferase [Burkholderiales bacterium]